MGLFNRQLGESRLEPLKVEQYNRIAAIPSCLSVLNQLELGHDSFDSQTGWQTSRFHLHTIRYKLAAKWPASGFQ